MIEKALDSVEFQKDMEEAIQKINNQFHLNIQCGMITYGEHCLVIHIEDKND